MTPQIQWFTEPLRYLATKEPPTVCSEPSVPETYCETYTNQRCKQTYAVVTPSPRLSKQYWKFLIYSTPSYWSVSNISKLDMFPFFPLILSFNYWVRIKFHTYKIPFQKQIKLKKFTLCMYSFSWGQADIRWGKYNLISQAEHKASFGVTLNSAVSDKERHCAVTHAQRWPQQGGEKWQVRKLVTHPHLQRRGFCPAPDSGDSRIQKLFKGNNPSLGAVVVGPSLLLIKPSALLTRSLLPLRSAPQNFHQECFYIAHLCV